MSYDLEPIKDTIKDHPVETVAAVGAVAGIASIIYYSRKQKREEMQAAAALARANKINWFTRYIEYRTVRAQLKLAALTH